MKRPVYYKEEILCQKINSGVTAPKGFLAGGVHCGVKTNNTAKKDIAIIYSEKPCTAAAVYTQNKVFGAPITVTRRNIADGMAQAVVCNSGNANTCNADGVEKAEKMCILAAEALHLKPEDIIVASTGVIGQVLPIEPIEKGIAALAPIISREGNLDAVQAIMTTDTKPKEEAYEIEIGGKTVKIGAMAKGSGMIHPNMATMLSVVLCDAQVEASVWQKMLRDAVELTFNRVTVDGDTSTNDTLYGLANGASGVSASDEESLKALSAALTSVLGDLAYMLVKDGEGASKVARIHVTGAASDADAERVARTVGHSQLVKTALYGRDANWGRIVAAVGRSGADFNPDDVVVTLCGVELFRKGQPTDLDFDALLEEPLKQRDLPIDIVLGSGSGSYTLLASDLGHEYVNVNADYRS